MAHDIREPALVLRDESLPYMDYQTEATAPPPVDDITPLTPTSLNHQLHDLEPGTPEGDNSVTLERQPIYAQVKKKADRDLENSTREPDEAKGSKDDEQITTRNVPLMPKHRARCVACGCPRVCCVKNFVFLWIVFFILIQGGPLAVLILDLMCIKSEGTTISRYIAEWNMEPAVCRVQGYFIEDFRECDCLKSAKTCSSVIKEYGCMKVMVNVYTYNQTGPMASNIFIWKSEREYVLDSFKPRCFNLDICSIDKNKPWYKYRNETQLDERLIQEKHNFDEGFVCYYKSNEDIDPNDEDDPWIVIMQLNTSFWQVLLWFFLPLAGILICWLIIFICLCWYCCPKEKKRIKESTAKKGTTYEVGETRYLMPYND